jgi:hypothetical protein
LQTVGEATVNAVAWETVLAQVEPKLAWTAHPIVPCGTCDVSDVLVVVPT